MFRVNNGILAILPAMLLATTAQASTIYIVNLTGSPITNGGGANVQQYTASCSSTNCIQGFFSNNNPDSNTPAVLSDSTATGYSIGDSSENNELAFLNSLLGSLTPPKSVNQVGTNSGSGSAFTTSAEYFSIKQQTWTAYFKNTSGGSITVEFNPVEFSHYTEYGNQVTSVPIPAAAWLFGSSLLGMIGIGFRRKPEPAQHS